MAEASTASTTQDGTPDDTSESFAFALVNGALGVFEVHGRRIRDFRYLVQIRFIQELSSLLIFRLMTLEFGYLLSDRNGLHPHLFQRMD